MSRRYTAVGLVVAFVIGAAAGGFAWSRLASSLVRQVQGIDPRNAE